MTATIIAIMGSVAGLELCVVFPPVSLLHAESVTNSTGSMFLVVRCRFISAHSMRARPRLGIPDLRSEFLLAHGFPLIASRDRIGLLQRLEISGH
jgi:hypothetical protein